MRTTTAPPPCIIQLDLDCMCGAAILCSIRPMMCLVDNRIILSHSKYSSYSFVNPPSNLMASSAFLYEVVSFLRRFVCLSPDIATEADVAVALQALSSAVSPVIQEGSAQEIWYELGFAVHCAAAAVLMDPKCLQHFMNFIDLILSKYQVCARSPLQTLSLSLSLSLPPPDHGSGCRVTLVIVGLLCGRMARNSGKTAFTPRSGILDYLRLRHL